MTDRTVREQWEKARKVDINGQQVVLAADSPLVEAAWMKHNLGPAKMALPNGYCGAAAAADLPARQCLPGLRHHPRIPRPTPPAAGHHPAAHRPRPRRRALPHGRDERTRRDEPPADRHRPRRKGTSARCELTTAGT